MPTSSDSFTGVDLSRLAAPSVIEALDYETIVDQAKVQFAQICAEAGVPFDATVESDPVVKLIELFAWRELILRQRVNDAARAVMPAFAVGTDLDHLAALFGIERFIVTPANPVTGAPAVLEADADFRRRMVLAPEGYSVAGPSGAYIFHALSASAEVLDAAVDSPSPGQVRVSIIARTGNGTASGGLIATVNAALSAEGVRPLTDQVTVQSAAIQNFAVVATLTFLNGPDRAVVMAAAQARLAAHLADIHRIGRDVTRAGIIGSLYVDGVQNVALAQPAADIAISRVQAPYCTGVTINDGGIGE